MSLKSLCDCMSQLARSSIMTPTPFKPGPPPMRAGQICPLCQKGTIVFSKQIHGKYSDTYKGQFYTKCSRAYDPRSTLVWLTTEAQNARCDGIWLDPDLLNAKSLRGTQSTQYELHALPMPAMLRQQNDVRLYPRTPARQQPKKDSTSLVASQSHSIPPAPSPFTSASTWTFVNSTSGASTIDPSMFQPALDTQHRRSANVSAYYSAPADFVLASIGASPSKNVTTPSSRLSRLEDLREAAKSVTIVWYSNAAGDSPPPYTFLAPAPDLPLFKPATCVILKLVAQGPPPTPPIDLNQFCVVINNTWQGRGVPLTNVKAHDTLFLGPIDLFGSPFIPVEGEDSSPGKRPRSPPQIASSSQQASSPSKKAKADPPPSPGPGPTPSPSPAKTKRRPITTADVEEYWRLIATGNYKNKKNEAREKVLGYLPVHVTWQRAEAKARNAQQALLIPMP
ncbi:hypothetical protein C8F01DRAFT_1228269 [Mycena amicta]|nr:hypothetical protein C8F01DRAFT_1228269 [Mycena amicta]